MLFKTQISFFINQGRNICASGIIFLRNRLGILYRGRACLVSGSMCDTMAKGLLQGLLRRYLRSSVGMQFVLTERENSDDV